MYDWRCFNVSKRIVLTCLTIWSAFWQKLTLMRICRHHVCCKIHNQQAWEADMSVAHASIYRCLLLTALTEPTQMRFMNTNHCRIRSRKHAQCSQLCRDDLTLHSVTAFECSCMCIFSIILLLFQVTPASPGLPKSEPVECLERFTG